MTTTSPCWHLLAASWRLRRGRTNYFLPWWGGQMVNNWPLSPRNPAWLCSPRTPTSPVFNHTIRIGDEVAPLNRTPKILGVTLNTHFTFDPKFRWLCRTSCKGPQRHGSHSWVEQGLDQNGAVSHLRAETGVLPLRAHLILYSHQFYARDLHPTHLFCSSDCSLTKSIEHCKNYFTSLFRWFWFSNHWHEWFWF